MAIPKKIKTKAIKPAPKKGKKGRTMTDRDDQCKSSGKGRGMHKA